MELFHINRWWRVRLSVAENPGSPFEGLIPPGLDDICAASPASAVSPLTAASATFALKAGLWFRRGSLAMVSLVPGIMPQSGRQSTYPSCPDSPSQLSGIAIRV